MDTTYTCHIKQEDNLTDEPLDQSSEEVDYLLNKAMKNLSTSSRDESIGGHASRIGVISRIKGDMPNYLNHKRKGSPINMQPRKFISIAEAVLHFHTNTPERFHTKRTPGNLNRSLQIRKGVTSVTVPHSPRLMSRLRSRPVHYLTREEEEEEVVNQMKLYQIKTCPLNPKILESPQLGVRIERKPPTVPVPFNLTEIVKKKKIVAPPVYTFTAQRVPRAILEASHRASKEKKTSLIKMDSATCMKLSKVKEGVKLVSEKSVHHFGISTIGSTERKHTTEVQPFSFEERDKLLLKKKEETIQKFLQEEKKCREFHAQPILTYIKSPNFQKYLPGSSTQPVSYLFEVDKRGLIKEKQLKLKLAEEAKKLQETVQFKARPATVIMKKPFDPKKSDRPITDITDFELNTEKRAKEREEFNCRIKKKQEELDKLRKVMEEDQKMEEIEEIERIRKETVHKANPIRRYKDFVIMSSDKPLTDPLSPSFFHRSKTS